MRVNVPVSEIEQKVDVVKQRIQSSHPVLRPSAEAAYKSFVAHYLEYAVKRVSGPTVADSAEDLATAMGLTELPLLPEDMSEQLKSRK